MSITVLEKEKIFKLDTSMASYVMQVDEFGHLLQLYFGAPVPDANLMHLCDARPRASFWAIPADMEAAGSPLSLECLPLEYPGSGTADLRPAALGSLDEDGDNVTDLRYDSYALVSGKPHLSGLPQTYLNEGEEAETLVVTLKDEIKGLYADLYYTVFSFSGAIARHTVLRNAGEKALRLTRAMTGTLSLHGKEFDLLHLWGGHAREFTPERTPIGHDVQSVSSFRGSSSHMHNPFVTVMERDAGEDNGRVWGINLVYSSNFIMETELDAFNNLRVNFGINDRGFTWRLEAGEQFETPEAVLVYSDRGLGDMSRAYQKLYQHNLVRGKWRDMPRPVLLNSWEGVYFNFDAKKLISNAAKAAELGIELFVLDDGWFGKRDDDTCALGDWVTNEKKLGCTMAQLADAVTELGMGFGLWFEPEMISPDSDLYRAHPDWCLHQAKRSRSLGRHQLILDMSRKDVQDYVVEAVSAILRSADIRYVKWDMYRNMAEVGSACLPNDRLGEIFHRYILGLYSVLERVVTAFPDVLFESCSGGGGRFDAGMMHYMPQNWTSDDSEAIQRLTIQYGCSLVYPPSVMTCHVSAIPNHQVHRTAPLHTRGNVAMQGSFGYELDMDKMTAEDKAQVAAQVQEYKRYRQMILTGSQYRLLAPMGSNECAFEIVSEDKTTAILTYVKVLNDPNPPTTRLRLKGLDAAAQYQGPDGRVYTGESLMNAGLNMPEMKEDFDSVRWVFTKI